MLHGAQIFLSIRWSHVSVSQHPLPKVNIAETPSAPAPRDPPATAHSDRCRPVTQASEPFEAKRSLTPRCLRPGHHPEAAPWATITSSAPNQTELGLPRRATPSRAGRGRLSHSAYKSRRGAGRHLSLHLGVFTNASASTLDRSIDPRPFPFPSSPDRPSRESRSLPKPSRAVV